MKKLKEWVPSERETEEDRQFLVSALYKELESAEPGDHTVYVGLDTLVYGTVGDDRQIHIFETQIRTSTEDFEEQQIEIEANSLSKGLLS